MEIELSLQLLRVVEQAAIACARTMGQGDRHGSDNVAVESMRQNMDLVAMDGTIVIGEGERDEAPMLFIGEKVGAGAKRKDYNFPAVDIAVDPLEGTNLCATGAPNAITVLAASEKGGLLHAPDLYMEKSSSARAAKAPWTWMLQSPTTFAPLPVVWAETRRIWSSWYSSALGTKN